MFPWQKNAVDGILPPISRLKPFFGKDFTLSFSRNEPSSKSPLSKIPLFPLSLRAESKPKKREKGANLGRRARPSFFFACAEVSFSTLFQIPLQRESERERERVERERERERERAESTLIHLHREDCRGLDC